MSITAMIAAGLLLGQAAPPAPADPRDSPEYWQGLLTRGLAEFRGGRWDAAEAPMRELYANALAGLGLDNPLTQLAGTNLGVILRAQGRYEESEAILGPILRQRISQFGEDNLETLLTAQAYAETLRAMGRYDQARDLDLILVREHEKAGRKARALEAANNLAAVYDDMGRTAEAERWYRRAWAGFRDLGGDTDERTLSAASNVAVSLLAQERPAEAVPILRAVLAQRRAVLGPDHPDTLGTLNNLAGALGQMGRKDEALALQREAWDGARRTLGDDHPTTLTLANNYAHQLDPARDTTERERITRHILEVRRARLGEAHPDTLMAANNLGRTLWEGGRRDEGEALVARSAEGYARRTADGEPPPRDMVSAWGNLGKMRLELDRPPAAYAAYQTAAVALRARYADTRATGGPEAAREALEWGRDIFRGQIRAGWTWAHEP